MPGFDPRESLGFQCAITLKAFVRNLSRRLEGSGVSPSQYRVLAHLMANEPLIQAELADLLSIAPPSAVKLIDRMERDGWLVREADPHDRRVKRILPTLKTAQMWAELSGHSRELLGQAYQGIDPAEIARVIEVLAQIRANLDEREAACP